MILFCKKEELLYCRECYVDGVGTRKLEKLIETNWGFDSRYKVVGYTKDRDGKVMRVFVNKYDDPEGDLVSESILWKNCYLVRGWFKKCSRYYYPLSEESSRL